MKRAWWVVMLILSLLLLLFSLLLRPPQNTKLTDKQEAFARYIPMPRIYIQ